MTEKSFTVAIDGPAAAGKGTVARAVAAHFGFAHLDTGLLYRATGLRTLDGTEPGAAAQGLVPGDLADEDALRTPDVAQAASRVAAVPEVRRTVDRGPTQVDADFARVAKSQLTRGS